MSGAFRAASYVIHPKGKSCASGVTRQSRKRHARQNAKTLYSAFRLAPTLGSAFIVPPFPSLCALYAAASFSMHSLDAAAWSTIGGG